MCKHDNNRVIKTTGQYFIKQCIDCGHTWQEQKVILKKKSLIQRLMRG